MYKIDIREEFVMLQRLKIFFSNPQIAFLSLVMICSLSLNAYLLSSDLENSSFVESGDVIISEDEEEGEFDQMIEGEDKIEFSAPKTSVEAEGKTENAHVKPEQQIKRIIINKNNSLSSLLAKQGVDKTQIDHLKKAIQKVYKDKIEIGDEVYLDDIHKIAAKKGSTNQITKMHMVTSAAEIHVLWDEKNKF